jgi:hypothetical protein
MINLKFNNSIKKNIYWLCGGLYLLALGFIFIKSAVEGYPIPIGDREWFYPVIFNLLNFGNLAHPNSSPIGEQGGNYIWHGFLFPVIQQIFSISNKYSQIEFSGVIIWLINCLLFILVVGIRSFPSLIIFIISVSIYSYHIGRPDILVSTVLLLDWYLYKKNYYGKPLILMPLVLSIIFCISPLVPLVYIFIMAIRYEKINYTYLNFENLKYILLFPLYIYFLFLMSVSDFTIIEWFEGIIKHAFSISSASPGGDFHYYLTNMQYLQYIFIVMAAGFLILIDRSTRSLTHLGLLVAFCFLIYFFAFRSAPLIHKAVQYVPAVILLYNYENKKLSKLIILLLVCFSIVCVKGMYGKVFDLSLALKRGHSANYLEESVNSIPAGKVISLPSQFFSLANKNQIVVLDRNKLLEPKSGADILYFSQMSVGYIKNLNDFKIKGYCLTESRVNYNSQVLYDWSYLRFDKC